MACKNTPHVHEASPGTRMLFLSIYLSYILHMIPCSYWASTCSAVLPSCTAYMLRVTSGRRFAAGFLQIPPHDGHPCLKLYPSHYRADSGLAPVRTCARRAHRKIPNTPKGVSGISGIMFNFDRMILWGANGAYSDIFFKWMGCNSRKSKCKHSTTTNQLYLVEPLGTSAFHSFCHRIRFSMR